MSKSGTTIATGMKYKAASTSGVRHGPSVKNLGPSRSAKGVMGSGCSKSTVAPIKGKDKGGL